jgi:H+/Cl- antiporter ClcA
LTVLEEIPIAVPPDDPAVRAPRDYDPVDRRTTILAGLAVVLAVAAALAAQLLTRLIGLVTNLAYHGRFVAELTSPAGTHRPAPVLVLIPIAGALIVGLMARYGSKAIRGHGIPEAM